MLKKKRTLTLALVVALAASMLLTSCKPVNTGSNGTETKASKYPGTKEAGTAVINVATEPPQLFSIKSTDTVSSNVLIHLLDGLTVLDKNDKPVGAVAKDWKISDDGLVYTFNLRNDYKWTNGEPVTAKDFEFAFKSLIDPKFACDYAYFGYVFKNGQAFAEGKAKIEDVGIKVIDDYKLELTLENPTSYFLGMLAYKVFYPVNQKAYEKYGEKYGTEADKMEYNGAFKMTSWQHESEIVMEKNPDYPLAKDVKINKIVMKMINDTNAAMNSFKSNEIDMIGLNGDQAKMLKDEQQPVYSYEDGGVFYFEFNTKDPLFSNKSLRQAMTYAIDSENFVKNVVKNGSKAAAQFTPFKIAGNKKDFAEEVGAQYKKHDVERAKKALEQAKKELGKDKIEVSMLIDDGDTSQKYAAFFQETWQKDLGIKVNIEVVPFKSRIERTSTHNFQMCLGGWGPDYNDPMTYLDLFETGNGNNHTQYSNPAYDELLKKIRTENDRDKRFGYLMDLEKLLMDDMPVGPYYFRTRDYTTSGKLSGIIRTTFQDINLKWAEVK